MSITEELNKINSQLPKQTRLIAVSKTHPVENIQEAYKAGQRLFGENKAQELKEKQALLPKDIEWHFIGHLQTNKIKYISPFVSLIHGVDSLKLLIEINKEAQKAVRVIDCLLQFHIAEEETKYGFSLEEAQIMLLSDEYKVLKNIRLVGVMGMATNTDNKKSIQKEFRQLKVYFDQIKDAFFKNDVFFKEISMGMSNDYPIAIEEGSTLIRVGSLIFGERSYQ